MIELREISKKYRDGKRQVDALVDVDLVFPSKGLYFVIGQSGAGKSTLLNILSLRLKPSAGSVWIDGTDCSSLNGSDAAQLRSNYFGVISQDLDMIDGFTIRENLTIGCDVTGNAPTAEEVDAVMKELGLPPDILDSSPNALSGGQRQRVAIGRAILKKSKALICDEPTGNLDPGNAKAVMSMLEYAAKESLVIVVSHDDRFVEAMGDGFAQIENGRITKNTLKNAEENQQDIHPVQPKKSRLGIALSAKLAFRTLRFSLKHTLITGISSLLGIALFLVSSSFTYYDYDSIVQRTLDSGDVPCLRICKSRRVSSSTWRTTEMDQDDVAFAKSEIGYTLPASYFSCLYYYIVEDETGSETAEWSNIRRASPFSEDILSSFGCSLVGEAPEDNEIVITFYQAVSFGWVEYDDPIDESHLSAVLGRQFGLYDDDQQVIYNFTISGILDTHYPYFAADPSSNEFLKETITSCKVSEMNSNIFVSGNDFLALSEAYYSTDSSNGEYHADWLYIPARTDGVARANRLSAALKASNPDMRYVYETRYDETFEELSNFNRMWADLLLGIGLVMLAISFISVIGFVSSSNSHNTKSFRILNDMGVSNLGLSVISFWQSLWLTLASVLISLIPYGIAMLVLNLHINNVLAAPLYPLTFVWWAPLLCAAFYLGACLIVSLVGTIKLKKRTD